MNELVELEQAERLKKWCRDYGVGIILGIVFAIAATMGWYYWQQIREKNLLTASKYYENLLGIFSDKSKTATVDTTAKILLQKYPKTPYASLTALQLAKQAVYQNKLAEAENYLVWVIQHGKSATLRAVARVRLARVLLGEDEPTRALKVLDENDNIIYQPLIFEVKGDVFFHLGNSSAALQNYLAAKKLLSDNLLNQPLLAMKINNLMKSG